MAANQKSAADAMLDFKTKREHYLAEAAECELIRDLATIPRNERYSAGWLMIFERWSRTLMP